MIVKDITEVIERFAPTALAEGYDNVGLMVGSNSVPVNGVLLALDVTEEVVDEAIELGVNMILSHHPLIFSGLKSIVGRNYIERTIIKAIKHNITIYSAHTNADSAIGGVSFNLAEKLKVTNLKVLDPKEINPSTETNGLGVYGELESEVDLMEFLAFAKERLNLKSLRYSTPHKKTIKKVAVCGGSGASYINKAKSIGADIYLTGDIKYHDYFLPESDITIADIGHYESEVFILDTFKELLNSQLKELNVYKSTLKGNPVNVL